MAEKKEKKEAPGKEGELKSSPWQTAPSQYHDSREERLGLLSEDPKFM